MEGLGGAPDLAAAVDAGAEETVQDVVLVGREDQPFHRQAHLRGEKPREDVTEVAGGDAEARRPVRAAGRQPEPRVKVVHHLGEQPHAVDRVDGPEAPARLEPTVVEQGLHDPLAVVERSLDGNAVNVAVRHRRHLQLLEAARPPLREQDEDPHVRLAAQGRDRGAAGVAARRAEHVQRLAGALELVVEEVPEELKGEVLEGEGRPVEELEEVQVSHRHEGGDLRGIEPGPVARRRVASIDERAKVVLRDVVHEPAEDLEGERRIGEPPPGLEVPGYVREPLRHQQPAVRRLTGHEGLAERDGRPRASRAHVSHGGKCSPGAAVLTGRRFPVHCASP